MMTDAHLLSRLQSVKLFRLLLLFVFMLVLLAAGCHRKAEPAAELSTVAVRAPYEIDQPIAVSVTGVIEAATTATAAFEVNGRVTRIYVEEGQHVNKGQLLAELDAADLRNAYEAASAQAQAAQALEEKARNGARAEELEQVRIERQRAYDERQRMKFLYERKSLSANDYQKYESAYQAAEQNYAMAQRGARPEDRKAAAAQARTAQAQQHASARQLSRRCLYAPIAGFVGVKKIYVGELAQAGATAFTVLDLETVKARVNLSEGDVGRMKIGDKAFLSLLSMGEANYEGRLSTLGVTADAASRTFAATVTAANAQHAMRDGMVAQATIYSGQHERALSVPATAVMRDAKGATVLYVYSPAQQRVYARRVTVSGVHGDEITLSDGLAAKELVVSAGAQKLHDGDAVRLAGGAQ